MPLFCEKGLSLLLAVYPLEGTVGSNSNTIENHPDSGNASSFRPPCNRSSHGYIGCDALEKQYDHSRIAKIETVSPSII